MSVSALIIAAGRGRRFGTTTDSLPKPLIQVRGTALIDHVLEAVRRAGIDSCTIVTGYRGSLLEAHLRSGQFPGLDISFIRNQDWERPNGISVLLAKSRIQTPFALLMSDHLFDFRILRKIMSFPLPPGHCRLAVDYDMEGVPDIEDATRVAVENGRIARIGKKLENYNAVDTGIFFCTDGIFTALETAVAGGQESLSDGVRVLALHGAMEAMDASGLFWRDVDDDPARRECEASLNNLNFR